MEIKDQIKGQVSILELISHYVDLKQSGKYYKGLCPFHTEKTPSFFVTPEKESFSCFGCNKFGDIFTFVQEIENLSFPEAMNFIIDKFNLNIKNVSKTLSTKKDLFYEISNVALQYFRETLENTAEGKKAVEYLNQRGIGPETIDIFSLGFSETKWDGLCKHLEKKSFNINHAIELGLLIRNQKNNVYDRFRGRIIIPIYSETGKVLAFGGRALGDDSPKYLNSPDTPIYRKGYHLYGFHTTKEIIKEKKNVILVEGYFDLISLYQHGVKNVAATLGTAFTETQSYILKRFAQEVYLFFDSDTAGQAATKRGIEQMLAFNINPKILDVTESKDPDDFIRDNGLKALVKKQENAPDGFRFLLKEISKEKNLMIPENKSAAVDIFRNIIGKISDPVSNLEYKKIAAEFFQIPTKHLHPKNSYGKKTPPKVEQIHLNPAEKEFIECLVHEPKLVPKAKKMLNSEIISVLKGKNIIQCLFQHYNEKSNTFDAWDKILQNMTDAEKKSFINVCDSSKLDSKSMEEIEENMNAYVDAFIKILNDRKINHSIDQRIKQKNISQEERERLMKQKYEYKKRKYNKM